MCGITGSFNKDIIRQGAVRCFDRGSSAYSLTTVDATGRISAISRICAEIEPRRLESLLLQVEEGSYMLLHQQAPTTRGTPVISRVHPVSDGDSFLWHNGILVSYTGDWDSKHLLEAINSGTLESVYGSYAFIKASILGDNTDWLVMRNSLCPLYAENLDICSVKLSDSMKLLSSNTKYEYNWAHAQLDDTGSLESAEKNDIYYIPEDS